MQNMKANSDGEMASCQKSYKSEKQSTGILMMASFSHPKSLYMEKNVGCIKILQDSYGNYLIQIGPSKDGLDIFSNQAA